VPPVPEHELAKLRSLQGYDLMLETDRITRMYNVDEATLQAMLTAAPAMGSTAQHDPSEGLSSQTPVKPSSPPPAPKQANVINKDQLRFEYDPSQEAAERRQAINQAILCSACGVALGIPDVRPIKVTCPACLFETTYTH
jgi:hypothetical protein